MHGRLDSSVRRFLAVSASVTLAASSVVLIPSTQAAESVLEPGNRAFQKVATGAAGSYTVPPGVIELQVVAIGSGAGGAGGGVCPPPQGKEPQPCDPSALIGGAGGSGAVVTTLLKVKTGDEIAWTQGLPGPGGSVRAPGGRPLRTFVSTPAGTIDTGEAQEGLPGGQNGGPGQASGPAGSTYGIATVGPGVGGAGGAVSQAGSAGAPGNVTVTVTKGRSVSYKRCGHVKRAYSGGIAKNRKAAKRQVKAGNIRPMVHKRTYLRSKALDTDLDNVICEKKRPNGLAN